MARITTAESPTPMPSRPRIHPVEKLNVIPYNLDWGGQNRKRLMDDRGAESGQGEGLGEFLGEQGHDE